ncbi:retinol dehydrogenase 11 [Lingula anatina]|uniref:Retinol dehydrogenase 11 n=1 Tax=Lingula anatina TaxID=7574 RepID=A0A1S3KDQ4_LINAN|nr:retinol dehydrogenase 11 [Lingula anatina]|eukprot:XP_013420758.1 retinol dehydrogenase 11 [Lingula anatina]
MEMLISVVIACLIAVLPKLYMKLIIGVCKSNADLSGKTAIVTGANTGLGYATALCFARRHARVILACQNAEKAEKAVMKIQKTTGNQNITYKVIDTSDLASVRKFAQQIIQEEKHLEILVNNAGIAGPFRRHTTKKNMELTMATNYFGHFLLTNLLLDLLKKSSPSRIINVSSSVHRWIKLDLSDLMLKNFYNMHKAYASSKLAMVLFTKELSKRLKDQGVSVYSVEPGTVRTDFFNKFPPVMSEIFRVIGVFYFRSPEEGAQTAVHCAVADDVIGLSGHHFAECAIMEDCAQAKDAGIAKKLWEQSEQICGLNEN